MKEIHNHQTNEEDIAKVQADLKSAVVRNIRTMRLGALVATLGAGLTVAGLSINEIGEKMETRSYSLAR